LLAHPSSQKDEIKALLLKYVDCFAWSYEEMPGLDPHKLKIDPNVQPVKQAPRRTRIELEEKETAYFHGGTQVCYQVGLVSI
jgi:hypothetical protein